MDLEILKNRREVAWKEYLKTHELYETVRINYEALKKQYESARLDYERADYALAEVDGRLQRIEDAKNSKASKVHPRDIEDSAKNYLASLSEDELDTVLKELGITLPKDEEEVVIPLPEDVKVDIEEIEND